MENNYTYEGSGIRRVRLKLTWAQAEVVPATAGQFQLIIAGDDDSVEELRIEQNDGDLFVSQPQLAYAKEILPRRRWMQICLRVPETWEGDLDVDTVAGSVGVHSVKGADVTIGSISGSLNTRDIKGNAIWLHTVSGGISAENLCAKKGNLRSVSGDMSVQNAAFEYTKVFTISGDVTLTLGASCRMLESQSVSGSVSIETAGPVRAALHSLSGQYILGEGLEAAEGGLTINASSVSGDLAVKPIARQ